MKKHLLSIILLSISTGISYAQMVLNYDIAFPNITIALPLNGTVNVSVNWGDGSAIQMYTTSGNAFHTFASTGTKTVTISGLLTQFGNGTNSTANTYLTTVTSWDGLGLTSLSYAFYNASLLAAVPASLPAGVTDLSYMFYEATTFNQNIGTWNTSGITNMNYMFKNALAFNQPIGTWNTAAVTSMVSMFYGAYKFDQPIGTWNTAEVTDMHTMFYGASSFDQAIDTWNTAKVSNMSDMFQGATHFNHPIGTWNTAAVTDMSGMFSIATNFNQPIGTWNTGSVTYMGSMFEFASAFNQDISTWNTASVTSMVQMFYYATSFNQPIGTWNTGAVKNMSYMFANATAFNQPIGAWNITGATNMSDMFNGDALCTDNYDNLLNGWATQAVMSGISFDGGTSKYSSAGAAARATLTSNGWTITDGGLGTTSDSKCTAVTSLNQSLLKETTNLYPNPATDHVVVQLPEQGTLLFLDELGAIVLKTNQLDYVNVTAMPKGVYLYQIQTPSQNYTGRLVKE